ncbi:MAG: DUF192 domain-containing protein [Anaerolineae bacterium]|nr:DUF192 domain-containing protein [Anaerolineae bacterium]
MAEWLVLKHADGVALPVRARRCHTFFCRLRGLMFRRALPPDEGLLFVEAGESRAATSIHMFFVFFPIGVIWLASDGTVVDTVIARPWRPYYAPCKPARYYLEGLPQIVETVVIGEKLVMEPLVSDSSLK